MNRFRRLLIRWEKNVDNYCHVTFCPFMDYLSKRRTFRIGSEYYVAIECDSIFKP
jgi:hypothetical protein